MLDSRGELEVETLLKIVLGLVAVLLVLEILGAVLGMIAWVVRLATPLILLGIGVLLVLWFFDRV
ncbi:hypothetical protein ACFO5R_03755 [Halosolutus amylolyticus]|uniref:Major facilitator superfamily (MFS) profile domain-containing protein n=1 Tax=Halosolutus amylolyticus TaxID=2932267 RepID=A0ABD5PKZ2_9EURY|nr:hypothetical protein [Halosolutus amylolyticus]